MHYEIVSVKVPVDSWNLFEVLHQQWHIDLRIGAGLGRARTSEGDKAVVRPKQPLP
jgi:hypothetical protein